MGLIEGTDFRIANRDEQYLNCFSVQNIISEATLQVQTVTSDCNLFQLRRFKEVSVDEYELCEMMLSQMNVTSVLPTVGRYRERTLCEYIGHC